MKSVEVAGSKFEVKDGFLDLGLLEIKDIDEIVGLSTIKNLDHDAIQAGEGDNGNNALVNSIVPVHIPAGGS